MGRMGRETIHSGGNVLPVPVLFRAFLFLLLLSPALGGCAPRNMRETAQVSPDREQNQPASPSQSDASDHPVSEIIWTDNFRNRMVRGIALTIRFLKLSGRMRGQAAFWGSFPTGRERS